MSKLEAFFHKHEPTFKDGGKLEWAYPLFELVETFMLTPSTRTTSGAHVRDPMDLKRMMTMVIYALVPAILFAWYNVGLQGYRGEGVMDPSAWDAIVRGGWHMLPIIITSYAAGGLAEMIFAVVRKHEINEGFLVTGILYPLTLPPSIPLWMVAMGIFFGVIIGKEVFGGVGMNILNPALTARAFVFFTYPTAISGTGVWDVAGKGMFSSGGTVEGYTGATPLLAVSDEALRGSTAVEALSQYGFEFNDLLMGLIPGSMGETSALAIALGAAVLLITGIGSWRIMSGVVIGMVAMSLTFNMVAGPEALPSMTMSPLYHLVIGSFMFGTVFMATDPVSAASTTTGRWIYGILIGLLIVIIRVANPAYPEGVMLAILFMNVFAPLIDHYVVEGKVKRRLARHAA